MDNKKDNVRSSVLDRLIDRDPGLSHEPVQFGLVKFTQLKASVIRDLERLLNTRRNIVVPAPSQEELNRSLFVYGLRDFSSQNPRSSSARQQIRLEIERLISRFEPRLRNVSVQFETGSPNERNLKFRINGLLVVDPISEPVTFDTWFDAGRGEYFIAK